MEHVGSDEQRKWGVDSQKCCFSPENLVHFWNLCNFRDFWFSFYDQIALKQLIDSKNCMSNGGVTCNSIFFRKIVRFQLLKVDCSGLSGQQLKNRTNFSLFWQWMPLDDRAGPMTYLWDAEITQEKIFFQKLPDVSTPENWCLWVIRSSNGTLN